VPAAAVVTVGKGFGPLPFAIGVLAGVTPPTPVSGATTRPRPGGGVIWPKKHPLYDDAPARVGAAFSHAQPPPLLWAAGRIVNRVVAKGAGSGAQVFWLEGETIDRVGGRTGGSSGATCTSAGTMVAIGDDDIERLMALLL
jgi:hypothetical protein